MAEVGFTASMPRSNGEPGPIVTGELETGDWARSRPPLFSTTKADVTKAECIADGLHDGCFCLDKVEMPWCWHVSSSQNGKCCTWWFSVGSMVRNGRYANAFFLWMVKLDNNVTWWRCDVLYLGQVHHSQIRPVWSPCWCWVGTQFDGLMELSISVNWTKIRFHF